jgi:hypothetical protein
LETVKLAQMIGYSSGYKNSRHHQYHHFQLGKFGWGGRIRTFTILINSEVSYRLDHAPAVRKSGS